MAAYLILLIGAHVGAEYKNIVRGRALTIDLRTDEDVGLQPTDDYVAPTTLKFPAWSVAKDCTVDSWT
jgi:hypothetical protein